MSCTNLMPALRTSTGIKILPRRSKEAEFYLPCGSCTSCRLARASQWALRATHEMKYHDSGMFLTLTYDDSHLPSDRSLHVEDIQGFIKRLRRHISYRNSDCKIRFFYCGEYGSKFGRPHWHLLVFGFMPSDLVVHRACTHSSTGEKYNLYTSSIISKLWSKGFCTLGHLTSDSAAYTARYSLKKEKSSNLNHYNVYDPSTGSVCERRPEFNVSSNGIGKQWCLDNIVDIFTTGFIVSICGDKTIKHPIPRYYRDLCADYEPELFEYYLSDVLKAPCDPDFERLTVRDKLVDKKISLWERPLDILTLDFDKSFLYDDPWSYFKPTPNEDL